MDSRSFGFWGGGGIPTLPSMERRDRLIMILCYIPAHDKKMQRGWRGNKERKQLCLSDEEDGRFEIREICNNFRRSVCDSGRAKKGKYASQIRQRQRGYGGIKETLDRLDEESIQAGFTTYSSLLRQCIALSDGKYIHAHIIRNGHLIDRFLANLLITMYVRCGSLEDARSLFDKMHHPTVVSWNIMIGAYAQNGVCKESLQLFWQMQQQHEGLEPNKITLINVLGACAGIAALSEGKLIHARAVDGRLDSDIIVVTALLNMYGKCGCVDKAREIFDRMPQRHIFSWNAMITAYAQDGQGSEALQLFRQMQEAGFNPDKVTLSSVLTACASLAALAEGKAIHARVVALGIESDVVVGTALLNMYGKCGRLADARAIFDRMHHRSTVTWNAMITAYSQHEHHTDALQLYQQMQQKGVVPDKVTFISILSACASLANLAEGKAVHARAVDGGFVSNAGVVGALVNMYSKCGSLEYARAVFDKSEYRNVISWTAIIAAYAEHGHGKEALQLFQQMQQECIKPDEVTFVSILSACSHSGLLEEGWRNFISMSDLHGITPTMEHYGCMVDLFGRAGRLNEAEALIEKLPVQPNTVLWKTLLSACRIHGDVQRGKRAAEHAIRLDPCLTIPYVLLSNIYAAGGMWNDVTKLRKAVPNTDVISSH